MLSASKYGLALAASIGLTLGALSGSASAIGVAAAKKCEALTAKAYPPRVTGNPAAGSAKGSGRARQAYFQKCVANARKARGRKVHKAE